MNNRLNGEIAHLQAKAEVIDTGFRKLVDKGVLSSQAANEAMLKQAEEVANFKQAVLNAVADGESRDSAITRLKQEFADKSNSTVSAFIPATQKKKPKHTENKLHNPVVQTLLQMGESLAAGNKAMDDKLQEEKNLDHKTEARRTAYLNEYYKLYDEK